VGQVSPTSIGSTIVSTMVELVVWSVAGEQVIAMQMDVSDTIGGVKRHIEAVTAVVRFRQRLLHGQTMLLDSSCLAVLREKPSLTLVVLPYSEDKKKCSLLLTASACRCIGNVDYALRVPVSPDYVHPFLYQGNTALHMASSNGDVDMVQLLCEAKANIDWPSCRTGARPLWMAAAHGHSAVVQLLCEARCNVDLANKDGKTPLLIASRNDHQEVVVLLCAAKADKELAARATGITPLHVAASKGHEAIVSLLCRARAAIDAGDVDGVTPLHRASRNNHGEVIRLLGNFGAS